MYRAKDDVGYRVQRVRGHSGVRTVASDMREVELHRSNEMESQCVVKDRDGHAARTDVGG